MGRSIFVSAQCLWFLVAGCANNARDHAPSGRPEITVTGTESRLIGLKLTDEMLKLGYRIREQSDHSIVFEKKITEWTAAMWPEGFYDMQPSSRVSYTLHEQKGTVRVVADLEIITKSGSRLERAGEAAHYPDSTLIEKVLQQTEHDLESQKRMDSQNAGGHTSPRQLK